VDGERHGRHGLAGHATAREGRIAEVLDDQGIGTALSIGLGIGHRLRQDGGQRQGVTGAAREGRQMHHADEGAPFLGEITQHPRSLAYGPQRKKARALV